MFSVLQVTPSLDVGGVERTTIEVAQALARNGGSALVASRGGRWEDQLARAGGELIRMPVDTKNPWKMWRNVSRLERVARRRGVQAIHARSRAPAWSAWLAARRLKLPFVTTFHGIYNARSPLKRFYNGVMARGDVVIANSEFTRAHILAQHDVPPERIVTIPRGVDLVRFDPARVGAAALNQARDSFGAPPGALVMLAPARLTAWKGQALLVKAFARFLELRPGGGHLALAGDHQGRDGFLAELRGLIASLELEAVVRIVGHVEDMPAALGACDVAVFPTIEPEAFGRGAVEAAAMGAPVIAAGHGGLKETVQDGETGLLFTPKDEAALVRSLVAMADMGTEGRRRMGAAGAAHVRPRYSTEALQAATLKVYERVIGSTR